jgi:hypothetical protein
MSQKYLRELIDFAQKEMPLLKNDLQNASTQYSLQAATQRLFNVLNYLLQHAIYSAYEAQSPEGPAAAPVAPVAPAPVVQPPVPTAPTEQHFAPVHHTPTRPATPGSLPVLPPPTAISQPTLAPSQLSGMPEVTIQPGVANVVITAQGTRVIAPSGVATTLPQGEAVDLAATTGRPIVPEAPPGVDNIVLPPGGGMSPETLAALSNLSAPTS